MLSRFTIILAVSDNYGHIPWKISKDFLHSRHIIIEDKRNAFIMGRKTHESLSTVNSQLLIANILSIIGI